jgi:equilibrative nucleoside transporter 1/2/3
LHHQHAVQASDDEHAGPIDSGLAYLCMVILGAGTLFPYNTMMTAGDFYEQVWPGKDLLFWAPLAASIFTPFVQMVMIKMQSRIPFSVTLLYPYAAMSVLVILLPLTPLLISDKGLSFYIMVIWILLVGFVAAVVQSTIFSLAAIFPPHFMQAVMAGQGWSGVAVSAARVITKATFPSDEVGNRNGAIVYFALSCVVTIACVFIFLYLQRMPFARHYLALAGRDEIAQVALLDDDSSLYRSDSVTAAVASAGSGLALDDEARSPAAAPEPVSMKSVLSNLGYFPCHIVNVFVLSFLIFPGLLASPAPSFDMSQGWFSLIMMCEFNVFDLIGRSLPRYTILLSPDTVWIGVYLRYLLYPLFFLAAHSDVFSDSSFWVLAFGVVFSISNGYISSLVMMFAPAKVPAHERGTAGGIMSVALTGGILAGSMFALAIQKLVKHVESH